MIVIAGHLEFADPAERDAVIEAAGPLLAPTLEEPGCRAYAFTADPCIDVRVQVFECWDDTPSLAGHFEHPNYTGMREVLRQGTRTATEIEKFRIPISEPVYDDTFTPRADFFTAGDPAPTVANIIIAGQIDYADRTQRDGAIAAGLAFQQATRDEEPGCQAYCFSPDPAVDTRIAIFELWDDEKALAAHFEHPNYFSMREVFGSFAGMRADARKYGVDLREPVYDDTRTARADFFTAPG